jgi:hypothetical protein
MNSVAHKTAIIDDREATNVQELFDGLKGLTLTGAETVQVQTPNGSPVKMFLMEETSTDGNITYTIIMK